ncbi:MAG: nickel-dependent lactate racemase [Chloroflexota bacterium]|nr:nickel-dependent lactate racemase [Chloroflexota bacterium]
MNARREIHLPYGAQEVTGYVPEANLEGIYVPQTVEPCSDPVAEIRRTLAQPLDTPPLSDLVQPGERVVVLVDDHTRTTPAAQILPLVLHSLRSGGIDDDDVTILITHGTHRLSTEEEVRRKVGDQIYGRFPIAQHRCTDEQNQVYVGLTGRGTPVWLNRLVVEADRCIGIGHVGPSPYAGYSGGSKLILPGVAALDTINANHSFVALGFRQPGRVDVPCRLDIQEAGALFPMDMVLDVVLCQDDRIARAFAGTPDRVFQQGLAFARRVYEVACPKGLDIALTAGYPYDIDLYQAVRAVEYADAVVREGGSILLVAACPEGVGGDDFCRLMAGQDRGPDDYLRDVVRRNGKVTFSVLGYCLTRIQMEKDLYIVTDGISDGDLVAMGWHHPPSLQQAVDRLLGEYGPQARVGVFPLGSATIPGSSTIPSAT